MFFSFFKNKQFFSYYFHNTRKCSSKGCGTSKVSKGSGSSGGTKTCTLILGDGVGPELMGQIKSLVKLAKIPITFEEFILSETTKNSNTLEDVVKSIKKNKVCLSGSIYIPDKSNEKVSLRQNLRNTLNLYAGVSRIQSFPGVKSKHKNVDMVVIREQTEGEYSTLEHQTVKGVVEHIKVITKAKSDLISQFAFEYATKFKRKKVTAVHKANIMKFTDGLFLQCCTDMAKKYPNIKYNSVIVDAATMILVTSPQDYDVLLMPNLYGSIVTHIAAGLVGGEGYVPKVSYSKSHAIFESIINESEISDNTKDTVNPTGILTAFSDLLVHVKLKDHAKRIENALTSVLKDGKIRTKEMGGKSSTKDFFDGILAKLKK